VFAVLRASRSIPLTSLQYALLSEHLQFTRALDQCCYFRQQLLCTGHMHQLEQLHDLAVLALNSNRGTAIL
jgi:hypothetical protein